MTNKIYFTIILCLCCFFSASAQVWPKYYGQQNRREYTVDIIETYDNGYLICGYYSSADYTQRWGWLIKTDVNGEIIWERIIENTGSRFKPASIEQTFNGEILIAGMSFHDGKNYPIVIKLNACGNKEWCKIFDGSPMSGPWAQDIKVTPTGDIIVLVNLFGYFPEESIHLFKLNSNGEILWKEPFGIIQNYPGSEHKIGRSLLVTSDEKYLISGYGFWENPWGPSNFYIKRPLFISADSFGNEEWVTPFGLNDSIIGAAKNVIESTFNTYISVGFKMVGSNDHGLFMEFDIDGNELKHSTYDFSLLNSNINEGVFHHLANIDSLYLIASFFGNSSWANSRPPGEILLEDINFDYLNILDYKHYTLNRAPYEIATLSSGKYLSSSTFRHSSTNYDIFLAKLNLNLEYDTAYTLPITYDSLCIPGPPQSGFIYLNNCDIVTGIEMPTAAEYRARISTIPIAIYPNPAKDQITFALENAEHHRNIELRCFNLLGAQQHQARVMRGQQQATANVSKWPPGMYIAVVYSDGKPVGRGKFVVSR